MRKIPCLLLFLIFCVATTTKANNFIVVGAHFPPWMYEKNGTPSGLYVDLLKMMLQEMEDVHISIKFYPVPRMLKMLSLNKDTFSLGIAKNEKLEPLYKWVGPIYPRIFAVYKLKDRKDLVINNLEDIRKYEVGVGREYAAVDDLLKAGVPRKNIQEVTVDVQNIRKLFARRIDCIVSNDMVLAYLLKKEGYRWDQVEQSIILSDQYVFSYAFNKAIDDQTIQRFQHSLDNIKQDGRYKALVEKYFN